MATIRDSIRQKDLDKIVEAFPDLYEGTIATPDDVRNRMIYQIDRYIQLDNLSQLTPQYRRFGRKHREAIWERRDNLLKNIGEPAMFRRRIER